MIVACFLTVSRDVRKIAALLAIALVVSLCFCLTGCGDSSFSVRFIDVGQGDAALVQCDGHYMLIDGGEKSEGDKVYSILAKQNIHHLDILVASHLHEDHIGGLIKALTYVSTVDLVLTNSTDENTKTYHEFEHQQGLNGLEITIPEKDREYPLGSATVKVVSNCSEKRNDSLVLLVIYGKTKFLFTGDIEQDRQNDIADQYPGWENQSSSYREGASQAFVIQMEFFAAFHHTNIIGAQSGLF